MLKALKRYIKAKFKEPTINCRVKRATDIANAADGFNIDMDELLNLLGWWPQLTEAECMIVAARTSYNVHEIKRCFLMEN